MPTLEQKVDSLAAYANNEMPKRIVTNDNPATVASGEIPVYTGAGLMTQKKTPAQLGLAASTDITTINTTLTNKADLVGGVVPSAQLPTLTDDTFIVQKNGSPAITAKWVLTALTESHTHTYPDKNINFGNLSFIATTNSNSVGGTSTNCHIMGCTNTVVDGTDNIAIGCKQLVLSGASLTNATLVNSRLAGAGYASGIVAVGVRNTYMQTEQLNNTVSLGSADNPDLFTYPVAACTQHISLFAASSSFPVSGTLYASLTGSQTLTNTNCLKVPVGLGAVQYEVDFIVSVGATGLAATSCVATGCAIMKRVFSVFTNGSAVSSITAVDTVGTDRTLGAISGTFTPAISLVDNTHVTVGITRAGGAAGQEAMAISARVRAHLTR